MCKQHRCLLALMPVLGAGLLFLSGCGGGGGPGAGPATKPGPSPVAKPSGKAKVIEVAGTVPSIKGRVTYNGDAKPEVKMLEPTKDKESCPKAVPAEGWYVKEDNKGIRYAVVFVKPASGYKLPDLDNLPAEAKDLPKGADGKPVDKKVIDQPHCQFEPRVLALHPKQKLEVKNTSTPPIKHDANVSGPAQFTKTLNPGESTTYDLLESDKEPSKMTCAQHAGTMSAYIWKMTHPYCVVTDENGNFELKDVIVPKDGKLVLAVWHEMLPGDNHIKEIGELDLKAGEAVTKDIAIPK